MIYVVAVSYLYAAPKTPTILAGELVENVSLSVCSFSLLLPCVVVSTGSSFPLVQYISMGLAISASMF